MNNTDYLYNKFYECIDELIENKNDYLLNPNYFTRNTRLSLKILIESILFMGANSIKDELYDLFDFKNTPTASAFVQQREKLKYEAFKFLFDRFNDKTFSSEDKLFKGYKLLAVDGTCVPISYNPNDKDTYVSSRDKNNIKGFNALHVTALYDLLNHTYHDVIIQGEAHKNENGAFNSLLLRSRYNQCIYICDRNFESLNSFVHVMKKKQKFLIRVKDIHSNGLLSSLPKQESEEFDIDYRFIATKKQTKEVKQRKDIYKFISNCSTFEHFEDDNPYYPIDIRIVRIKIDEDNYESIITNLDRDEFSTEDIKILYGMRWGIETSFRELKYAVGLNAFHAKKRESIKQEIYAKLLFYNFSERIMIKIKPRKAKKYRKYIYAINSTKAFHNIRIYLKRKKGGKIPPDIEVIIANEIEPVRPGRSDPRKIKKQNPVHFVYRLQ